MQTVLEDSLKTIVDPKGSIKSGLQSGDSHIEKMLLEAKRKGLLDDYGVSVGRDIKCAGNDATHDPSRFRAKHAERVRELVDGLRKVPADLHGVEAAS